MHRRLAWSCALLFSAAACGSGGATPSDGSPADAGADRVDAAPQPPDAMDAATPDAATPDAATPDAAADAAPDAVADAARADAGPDARQDAPADAPADAAACDYLDLEINIVRCGADWAYLRRFTDTGGNTAACPPYFTLSGVRFADRASALASRGCDARCVYTAGTSVSYLRCGRRSGYIVFRADGCPDIYEYPEGIYESMAAYERANPCP